MEEDNLSGWSGESEGAILEWIIIVPVLRFLIHTNTFSFYLSNILESSVLSVW